MERLIVLGAGGIGGGIGGMLARAGLEVGLIARGPHGKAIATHGLTVKTPDTAFTLRLPTWSCPADVDWRPGDVCMVATKLADAEAAYEDLLRAAGPEICVVAAQNGLIGDTWAKERFSTVWRTMIWVPAEHLHPGEVRLYGQPIAGAIDVEPAASALAEWARRAGFDSTIRSDLDRWKRAKWITNLCGSAVVFGHADWVPQLIAEGHAVLAAAGLDTASKQELKNYIGHIGLGQIDGDQRLPGGSTAQSHARGRPLEIPWLNGAMVELARKHGVATPYNDRVLHLVENTDKGRGRLETTP